MDKPNANRSIIFLALGLLLLIAFWVLFNTIWSDISDWVNKGSHQLIGLSQQTQAAMELRRLIVHFFFVAPLLILSLFSFFAFRKLAGHLKAITTPLLLASTGVFLRLFFDAGSYLIREYQKAGLYLVLIGTIIVLIAVIIFIQRQPGSS